jgi:hypothetical protein
MKVLNIMSAFIVVVCNIWVSFNHSLELFLAGGFKGGLEYVAVVGVEVTFLMGGLNIVASRLKGVSPGAPAVMGGLLGVLLVSWSNIAAGWAYGITGVLLGLATPISLLVAEAILSRAIMNHRELSNQEDEAGEIEQLSTSEPVSNQPGEPTRIEPVQTVENVPMELVENAPDELVESTNELTNISTDGSTKKSTGKSTTPSTDKPTKLAWKIYHQTGSIPTRTELMKKAKCTQYQARKTLAELKQQIS